MTDTEMTDIMARTKCALARHLEDLMDEIDQANGRISSRKLLGGIHEAVDTMSKLDALSETAQVGTMSTGGSEKAKA